ncbi:YwpF family protein [Ornithinibacillus halophilus]|uniref:YwpF-like protein n=1 Tax=Ornithinibacillus halophilus TaxID=930117 RepID=A0A1M5IA37_9BACI|nr:YwpF family protein [Ornithinibacillus halophilus]SHG24750.1 YwpF-like protein [Ornithinibacillus halophilus]
MKTFKLKEFQILVNKNGDIVKHPIQLIDGLIINREDEKNRWTIEAYIEQSYFDFFEQLKGTRDEIMVEVRITKESNEPATFISSIIGINKIESNMNVLLSGQIVDQRKSKIEGLLTDLVQEGYQGEELIDKFKDKIE